MLPSPICLHSVLGPFLPARPARTHETAASFEGHKKLVDSAAFSPDSRLLATCSRDSTVRLWQVPSGACRELPRHTDQVYAVAFHKGSTRLATGGRDGAVWLWDLKRGEEVARLPGHTSYVWSLAFNPDGKDAGVRLRRLHRPPLGHDAAEDAQ